MIVAIEGKLEKKDPTFLHININGLVYEVLVSLNCSAKISGENIRLLVKHIIKEESDSFYGFLEENEKKLFCTLIKINGIGPKVALAICSTFTPSSFAKLVLNNDVNLLKKVPGIGLKSASRILVELSGFIVLGEEDSEETKINYEASQALESLGFKKDLVRKTLATCIETELSTLIKEALKKLQK